MGYSINLRLRKAMFQSLFCHMFPLGVRTMTALKLKFLTFTCLVLRLGGTAVSSHPFHIIFKSSGTVLGFFFNAIKKRKLELY